MKMSLIDILSLLFKVAVSIPPIPDADDQLHIYALPVGQGDCTVIQCPFGYGDPVKGTVTIIDAGSSKFLGMKNSDIVDFLAGTELHLVVLTHSDKDHINYMNHILNSYAKKVPVYHSCEWATYTKNISSNNADPRQVPYCYSIKDCAKKLNLCPNYQPDPNAANSVTLSIVASAYKQCVHAGDEANNEDSIISKVTYVGKSTLITGDFELPKDHMRLFLDLAGPDLKSDIYKVSHHGAYTYTNNKANRPEFLDAIGASYVFSSSGFKYPYNHPRCQIYDYYDAKFSDNAVAKHPYTCYNSKYEDDYKIINTRKPIYVTSVYLKTWLHVFGFNSEVYMYHMIVKFDITITGRINVETMEVRDVKDEL
uniref:Metallo-beta-lactamase domain-containing protein n=1 Tax=Amphimedon queenslandica TaxID=400682 RepID=A0A1X7TNQ0_AMPQE